jgi:NADH-quinone oxidoreductase subunit F
MREEIRIITAGFGEKDVRSIDGYIENAGGYSAMRKVFDPPVDPDALVKEIDESGLRGRGGAGFATGKKASFIPKGEQTRFLTCNADESEPGTFKDRQLMQYCPHRLVEGCILASYSIGASFAFIYIRGEYELQAEIVEQAVREAYERGFLGENILGSRYSLELVVHRGAGAYICGEESALLDSLEGKRGNPRLKPPFPAIKGLYQGPTLINNVETLSNVPLIIERGAKWWRSHGTEKSPGTKVVSVSGNVRRPGNYEIELGIPARELVYDLAGGPLEGRRVKFWHPGGSSAPVLLEEHLDLAYDFETMAQAGSMLGSGAIIVADDTVEVLPYAKRLAQFYRHESCGKCVPCREGTNWTVKMLERIENGDATPMDLDIMGDVQDNIEGNCLCVLGDSMAMPVRSLLKHFRDEFAAVMEAGRFSADQLASEPAGEGSVDVRIGEGGYLVAPGTPTEA